MTCLLAVQGNPPSWHRFRQYDLREDDDDNDGGDQHLLSVCHHYQENSIVVAMKVMVSDDLTF